MFNEWYRPNCCLEFPRGGSQAIVQALVRYYLPFSSSLNAQSRMRHPAREQLSTHPCMHVRLNSCRTLCTEV